jgi:DNA polymerase-3 subunit delta
VTGPEEFLNDRMVRAARAAVRRAAPDADVTTVQGDQLTRGSLGELTAPSLFATTRVVEVRQLEDVPEETHEGLVDYAAAPDADVALVLVHSGGQKGSGLLGKLRKLGAVHEHKSEQVKAGGLTGFVLEEGRRLEAQVDRDAAEALVEAVGADLRALAAAVEQLTHDFPGRPLTPEIVGRYFSGRADVKGYVIAEHALSGRTAQALEELRWALETGVGGPAITGSFASAVRSLARLKGAGRGMRDADLAREVGVPPFRIRHLRDQLRGWDERGLGEAVTAVAVADADVKGAGADAGHSLERMVIALGAARGSGRQG